MAQLSIKMRTALMRLFGSEVDMALGDYGTIRAGIIDARMIPASTATALVEREYLTYPSAPYGAVVLRQITAAGCEAIGRSMDEIVAWAWDRAMEEYFVVRGGYAGDLMRELPQPAPQGWTPPTVAEYACGLRDLAEFLDAHAEMPTPKYMFSVSGALRSVGKVIHAAQALGVEPGKTINDSGDIYWIAARDFGPVGLQLSYIERAPEAEEPQSAADVYADELYAGTADPDGPGVNLPPAPGAVEPVEMSDEERSAVRERLRAAIDKDAILRKPIDSLLNSGVSDTEREAPVHRVDVAFYLGVGFGWTCRESDCDECELEFSTRAEAAEAAGKHGVVVP